MKIIFKKIPKLAVYFYLTGFAILLLAVTNYFIESPFMSTLLMQQIFIAGAIIVALGSLINSLYQFRRKN